MPGLSQTLLGRVAAGEVEAVRECIAAHEALVWTIARRIGPSLADAEEGAQEIFRDLWVQARDFDPERVSETAFVAMIARRRMIDRLRELSPRPELRPVPESAMGTESEPKSPEASLAKAVIATLDPRQRRVLSLAIGQGLTHTELSELATIPKPKVKSLVRKAIVAIRKRLIADKLPTDERGGGYG